MKGVEAGPWSWSISGSFLVVVIDSLGFISCNFFGPQILYLKMSNVNLLNVASIKNVESLDFKKKNNNSY